MQHVPGKDDSPHVATGRLPGYYRYVIEAILFLTYGAFGMTWSAAGSFLKEIMEQLSLTLSQASFINTSVCMAKIVGPVAAGFILSRLGPRKAFLLASGLVCVGILSPFSTGFGSLLLARFTMGLGGAMIVVYFTPIVMEWFAPGQRETVNGLNHVSISLGMMLGLLITRPLMEIMGGSWRRVLLIYSLISMVLFVCWALLGKNSPHQEDSRQRPPEDVGDPRQDKALYKEMLRDPSTWKMIFTYSGFLSLYMVIMTYMPTYYRLRDIFTPESPVHLAPPLAMFMGIPATLLGIHFARSTGLRVPTVRISGILLIPGTLGLFLPESAGVILACAMITGVGMFLWRSAFFTIPQELPGSTPRRASYMMGIFWAASYTAGTICTYLTGVIIESTGSYHLGFYFITLISTTMFAGSFILPETGPGRLKTIKAW